MTDETIRTMFENNSDGSGYMYAKGGKVHISKGYMNVTDFLDSIHTLKNIDELPLIMHFRITTHGGTSQSNTHPFPLTNNINKMKKLDTSCKVGIAHNGVISSVTPRKGISDTMEYIATILEPLYALNNNFF